MQFSIVIPTYNRPHALARCLEAIVTMRFSREHFEVIVVDDGGTVALETVVSSFYRDLQLTLLTQANAGPAAARNHGATVAKGKYLAFIDDDCSPHAGWLHKLSHQFQEKPRALLGGRTINTLAENAFATTSQLLIDYLYEYHQHVGLETQQFFTSNNMAVPAELFHWLEGFDTTMSLAAGEDREFCDRWVAAGHALCYVADALVYHAHDLTLGTFCRQHFNYGRGAWQFHRRRQHRRRQPIQLEPLRFYGRLLAYPFEQSQPNAFRISLLLLLSQICNAAGFAWETLVKRGL